MSRGAKSQWDFGELFDPASVRRVITVSELTATVRRVLEREVRQVWVTGEISNFRLQPSGHIYFTLKDSNAQLQCVVFRGDAVANRQFLKDGQKVIVQGDVTVYEPRGQYQLRVLVIEPQGVGALQVAFEKLKQKLNAEGLFAAARKRPLPRYPARIGIVTSPTGAAIRDVLHVIQRRHPALELVFAACRVQGQGAAEEIACAIDLLNEWSDRNLSQAVDLILVTRGGGSLEDLWAFNEEVVARAISRSRLPVVSAIGHEIDFTISDFVADFRAATPSAAAEILTEGFFASRQALAETGPHLRDVVRRRLEDARDAVTALEQRLRRMHPRRVLQERMQYLDDAQATLLRCVRVGWRQARTDWTNLRQRLWRLRPSAALGLRRQELAQARKRLREQGRVWLKDLRGQVAHLLSRLRLLSAENVLARGYSITSDAASGAIVCDANATRDGQKLKTRLASGEVRSVVEK